MRTRRWVILAIVLGAIAVAAGYALLWDHYRLGVEAALRGDLRQANFRPHVDWEWVSINDAAELSVIRNLVVEARTLPVASFPPASCDLQFVFADGRIFEMKISPTGITANNFFQQDPASFEPLGYVILEWSGHYRTANATPFNDILRRQNRVAAPSPRKVADAH